MVKEASGVREGADAAVSQALTLSFLAETFERAHEACNFWAAVDVPAVRSLADFRRLPILERATVRERLLDLCPRNSVPQGYVATSGTSTGQPLFIPRCDEEVAARSAYRIATGSAKATAEPGDGMVLRLHPAGRAFAGGGGAGELAMVFLPDSASDIRWDNWDSIISHLFARVPSRLGSEHIRILHATPGFALFVLTRLMLQRGVDPAETEVRHLIVSGAHTPTHKRAWLTRTWRARFITTFSCSEIPGWAMECQHTPSRYHFDHTIFPEVVDPKTGTNVEAGQEGRLLLTGIYPYQSACALLRYAVGDWARWVGFTWCKCGVFAPTIDHLGRESRVVHLSAVEDGRPLVLSPVPTSEALAAFDFVPDVPRAQFEFRQSEDGRSLELHVECYHVRTPAWQERTSETVRQAVLNCDPTLRTALARHCLTFSVKLWRRGELTNNIGVR